MHRWDSIGYYGDPYAQTPKLDRLSTEGIRYNAARDPNPLCMACRSDPPPQPYIPAPPVQPEDLADTQAMEKYRQEKEEYDEVVSQIRANYNARVEAFKNADKLFEKGFVSFVAVSESVRTTCHFDDAWLWLIN